MHADAIARFPSWLATLLLFAAAARLPRGSGRGWLVALAAASPLLLLYAAEARAYALLALLDFAAFLLLFRGDATFGRMATATAVCAAAAWTHYLALFFLAAAALRLLVTRRWRELAAVAAGALLFAPWTPILFSEPPGATAWMRESTARSIPALLSALGGAGRIPNPFGGALPGALVLAGTVVGAALVLLAAAAARGDRETADPLVVGLVTIAAAVAASLVRPVAFPGRTEMAILPIWLWAVARAACRDPVWSRRAAAAAVGVALLSSGVLLARPRVEPTAVKLSRTVASLARPGDAVIAGTSFYLPVRLAADRRDLLASVSSFPDDLAAHPGWFVSRPPQEEDWRGVERKLAGAARGSRVFLLLHPFYVQPELLRLLAKSGRVRTLVQRRDAVLLEWTARR